MPRVYRFTSDGGRKAFLDTLHDQGCNYILVNDAVRVPFEEPWVEAVARDHGGLAYEEPENQVSTSGVDAFLDVDAHKGRSTEPSFKLIRTKRRPTLGQP